MEAGSFSIGVFYNAALTIGQELTTNNLLISESLRWCFTVVRTIQHKISYLCHLTFEPSLMTLISAGAMDTAENIIRSGMLIIR